MTWNELIKAYGDVALWEDDTIILCSVLIISLVLFVVFYIFLKKFDVAFSLSVITTCILCFTAYNIVDKTIVKDLRQEWVKNYAIPYIEHLPNKKIIIDNYFIIDEEDKKSFFTKKVNFDPITLYGRNELGEPVSMRINVRIQPKEHIQKPYLIYKKLEKKMPYKFKKGYYNAILFIPSKQSRHHLHHSIHHKHNDSFLRR
jgi:hypothetical protein